MIELVPENKTEIHGKKLIRVEVHPNPGKSMAGPYLTPVYEQIVDDIVDGMHHPRLVEVQGENWYLNKPMPRGSEVASSAADVLVHTHAKFMPAVFGWFMERDDVEDSVGVR